MNIKEFLRKSQIPMMLGFGTYPLAVCVIAWVEPALLSYVWLFPLSYAVLGILSLLLPPKLRLVFGILGALLFFAPGVLYFQSALRGTMLLLAAMYAGMLLWGLQLPAWEPQKEPGAGWIGSCFAIVCVCYFIACFEDRVSPAAGSIRFALFAFIFFAMLSMNRGSLNLAMGESHGFTAAMRRRNLLLTAGMFGIALLIAVIPSLFNLVKGLYEWILWLIGWLRDMLAAMLPEETTVATTTETTIPPSTFENWQEVVLEDKNFRGNDETVNFMMTAIVLVVMIPFLTMVVIKLTKLLIKGVRRLAELIDHAANAHAEDYIDEITDTRDEDVQKAAPEEKKTKRLKVVLGKLTPQERIRYRYRRLQSKHPEWKAHNTARDNLEEEAAKLYERARYSDHPITEQDADQFQNETK